MNERQFTYDIFERQRMACDGVHTTDKLEPTRAASAIATASGGLEGAGLRSDVESGGARRLAAVGVELAQ